MSELKNIWASKLFRRLILVLVAVIVTLFVFQAGRFVGFRQASFSYRLGDNYYRAFEGRRGGMMGVPSLFGGDLPGGHGAVGKIVKITLPTITISTPDNIEKTVLINSGTIIKQLRQNGTSTDLKVDDMVVVVGQPTSDAQIEAKLIRILPPPPAMPLSATNTPNK